MFVKLNESYLPEYKVVYNIPLYFVYFWDDNYVTWGKNKNNYVE